MNLFSIKIALITCQNYIYRVCQKKKDILNIHVKSGAINIFSPKFGLVGKVYHVCGQLSKNRLYSPIIH